MRTGAFCPTDYQLHPTYYILGQVLVFHFPGVVENVPGHASNRVAHRPPLVRHRLPVAASGNGGVDRLVVGPDRIQIESIERRGAHPELACVTSVGLDDVVQKLVPIAPTAARPLPQFGRHLGHHLVEETPARPQHRHLPCALVSIHRFPFQGVDGIGNPEIGDAGALDRVDHIDVAARIGNGRDPCQTQDGVVARAIGK